MVGEPGTAAVEFANPQAWVQNACRAAAIDLAAQLVCLEPIERLVIVSPEELPVPPGKPMHYRMSPPGAIHVGHYLAEVVETYRPERLLYFGGGSAPLLSQAELASIVGRLLGLPRGVLTNNLYASDWAGVSPASTLVDWQGRLPKDNMLGWVLSTEAGLPSFTAPANAPNRLDIDTPTDLLTLRLHPGSGLALATYLDQLPLDTRPLEAVLEILRRPAGQVFIAGRLGPLAWQALNQASQCWLRVFAEERGMVSSGRLARGEVFSFLADYIDRVGLEAFFTTLAQQAQAALIDTRVLLAHRGTWPRPADRFASDLGLIDQIRDPWLREFTAAAGAAPVPIILGGHGLLAGDLFAFCDLL